MNKYLTGILMIMSALLTFSGCKPIPGPDNIFDWDGDGYNLIEEEECNSSDFTSNDWPHSSIRDIDQDGICNALDDDDDGDGFLDDDEIACGSFPDDWSSTPQDTDGDGLCDGQDSTPVGDIVVDYEIDIPNFPGNLPGNGGF